MEQAAFKVDSDSGISVRYRNAITYLLSYKVKRQPSICVRLCYCY